jgi:hypothetical protein
VDSLIAALPPSALLVVVIVIVAVREVRRAGEDREQRGSRKARDGRTEPPPRKGSASASNGDMRALRSIAEATGTHELERKLEAQIAERTERRRILDLVERHDASIAALASSVEALSGTAARSVELLEGQGAALATQGDALARLCRLMERGRAGETISEMEGIG